MLLFAVDGVTDAPPKSWDDIIKIIVCGILYLLYSEWKAYRVRSTVKAGTVITAQAATAAATAATTAKKDIKNATDQMAEFMNGDGILSVLRALVAQIRQNESKGDTRMKDHSVRFNDVLARIDKLEQVISGTKPRAKTKVQAGDETDGK